MPERIRFSIQRICPKEDESCPVKGKYAVVRIASTTDDVGILMRRAEKIAIDGVGRWCPNPCSRCRMGVGGDGFKKGIKVGGATQAEVDSAMEEGLLIQE